MGRAFRQQRADALSKLPELTQWSLHPGVYRSLWGARCLDGRTPDLDAFADEATTKVPGSFFSAKWSPNSLGINALAQSWTQPPGYKGAGRPLLFINPPFELMGKVVRKLREELPDCVLIAPQWPRWWRNHLKAMPHRRHVTLLPGSDLFGYHTPQGQELKRTPQYRVEAWYFVR